MSKRVADTEIWLRSCAEAGTAGAGRQPAVAPVTSGARSLSWMSRGACQQADPELFFPVAAGTGPAARQVEAAKAVCGPCAVRANCLSYALEAMPEGIWGGTTQEERRAARGRLFSRRVSAQSRDTVSASMTGEDATCVAEQPVRPSRITG
jgi:WhiB family transcriptional regulator, redox-sensing transcriptional regulator